MADSDSFWKYVLWENMQYLPGGWECSFFSLCTSIKYFTFFFFFKFFGRAVRLEGA